MSETAIWLFVIINTGLLLWIAICITFTSDSAKYIYHEIRGVRNEVAQVKDKLEEIDRNAYHNHHSIPDWRNR